MTLVVANVEKRFEGLIAIADASLRVDPLEIVALIGPNGAGKTTLFSIISGFVAPDGGAVRFCGEDVTGMPAHWICAKGIARTFQITQPFVGLSVLDNIAVGSHLRRRARSDALAHARAIADRVGLGAAVDKPASALTVAARKRLELARALATAPKLLLLDEVMAGLNPTEMREIIQIVRGIRADGVSILLTEHVIAAVLALADRTYVLSAGRIIAEGEPNAVVRDPQVIEAYLGHESSDCIQGVGG